MKHVPARAYKKIQRLITAIVSSDIRLLDREIRLLFKLMRRHRLSLADLGMTATGRR